MTRASRLTKRILLVVPCLMAAACITLPKIITVPARSGAPTTPTGSFRAGVKRVDITPIPGVPLGGYSIDGKFSRGFWTRLHARALYLEDANQTPLVLISTDLSAITGGLGDEVTRILNEEYGLTWISREHVLAASTHTHHGPGNYYTDRMFNQSPSPEPGFDEALFDFLARRLAFAVKEAWLDAKEADLFVTDASALASSGQWKLKDFFRNRSLEPFLLNPRAKSLLDPDVPATCPGEEDGQPAGTACKAVRPQVELLAIRQHPSTKFIGVAAFVPVHPTVLPQRLEVFSSDLFGVAAAKLERLSACGASLDSGSVVAFFNGAEGDVSPTWTKRNRQEVLDRGDQLASKMCTLLASGMRTAETSIEFRFDRVEIPDQSFDEKVSYLDQDGVQQTTLERRTEERGRAGAAAIGGAEDGRSILHELLGHREGYTLSARGDHGPKSPVGSVDLMGLKGNPLSPVLLTNPPPVRAHVAVYKIGSATPNVVIVALPGEFTTQMGRRVREAVFGNLSGAKPDEAEHVLLVGLANEYLGYITTPEEYDAQHYEGAMTLYGPASGPFLARKLANLAALSNVEPTAPKEWTHYYNPGPTIEFQPKDVWGAPYNKDDGLVDLLQDANGSVRRDLPVYCWRDAQPRLEDVGAVCKRSNPEVFVTKKFAFGAGTVWLPVADNHGLDLVTVVTGVGEDASGSQATEWCAVWLGAPQLLEPTRMSDYRFDVRTIALYDDDGVFRDDRQSSSFGLVDGNADGWLDDRFLQHPDTALDPSFPLFGTPAGQCTVPPAA